MHRFLIDQFLTELQRQKHRSTHTLKGYERDICQFFNWMPMADLTRVTNDTIAQYLKRLHDQRAKNPTIYRKLVALKQFWEFLKRLDMVTVNPWADIRRPKTTAPLPTHLEEPVVLELLNNYPTNTPIDIRNKAILELLFASGIRVGELTGLTMANMNVETQECRVLGKGNKERVALFGHRAKVAIWHYLHQVRPQWSSHASPYVFTAPNSQSLSSRTVQRIVKSANQYHSSPIQITPHSCRHTCASLLITNGAPIRDVQEFLGHSSIITTQKYTHIPTKTLTQRFLNAMDESVA